MNPNLVRRLANAQRRLSYDSIGAVCDVVNEIIDALLQDEYDSERQQPDGLTFSEWKEARRWRDER